jgi:hypothetical protein
MIRNKNLREELISYFPLTRHGQRKKRRAQQFFYCCVCIRFRGNVSLPSRLPSNDCGIHIQTHGLMGFMKYAVEMGSDAMIYIQSLIKFGSGMVIS